METKKQQIKISEFQYINNTEIFIKHYATNRGQHRLILKKKKT